MDGSQADLAAEVVRSFRSLIRDYIDLASEDWNDDVTASPIQDLVDFVRVQADYADLLREVVLCLFLDPNGTQEALLFRPSDVGDWDEAIAKDLSDFYLRRPRARGRFFSDLAARLGVAIGSRERVSE